MIAAISLMRRIESVSLARFRRHWLDIHGPMVCAFPGLRRYVQCHVLASPVMNAAAREMRIDGFPILFFDSDTERLRAHQSPEMAACNIDSRQFIGAVSRIITEPDEVVPVADERGRFSIIALHPGGAADIQAEVERFTTLPRLRRVTMYRVREQGRAPASTVPHLAVTVAAVTQAWFDSLVDLESALDGFGPTQAACFATESHWLV